MEVFNYTLIETNNKVIPEVTFDFLQEDEEFGVLTIKTNPAPITNRNTLFLFTVDITGSMNERANLKNTKMDIVKQTFKGMINHLSTVDAPIYIRIHCFNTSVTVLNDTILVRNKNELAELYSMIDGLFADGATDIGLALKEANKYMDQYTEDNPSHQICHIFMTDGHATSGITVDDTLCDIISDKYASVFIGFGDDHNINLMKKMTTTKNATYQFINNMEDTGLIYGESIHPYLYPSVRMVEIKFTGCLVYDWKNNKWTDIIKEDALSSEVIKIYHIKKDKYIDAYASIYGVPNWSTKNEAELIEIAYELPKLIDSTTNTINTTDLTRYMFRQKTLSLLFDAKTASGRSAIRVIRTNIHVLFNQLRKYMRDETLLGDGFMKQLCDDLTITYRNIGTERGNMFIMARYTSQARQQTYSATPRSCERNSDIDMDNQSSRQMQYGSPPRLQRSLFSTPIHRFPPFDEDDQYDVNDVVVENQNETEVMSESEIDSYVISENTTSCYANECTLRTMSQMTQPDLMGEIEY